MLDKVVPRTAVATLLAVLAMPLAACGSRPRDPDARQAERPRAASRGRLIILGFDGVDPRWLEGYAREGKMPNAKRLIEANGGANYRPLGSTNPPQSPVAWTTFATGTNPGEHGIYDFVRRVFVRDPQTDALIGVAPIPGTTSFEVPAAGPPMAATHRSGIPFWKVLADDGVPSVVLNVPYSFPPDPVRQGSRILSGLGTPDLRGSNSIFTIARSTVDRERVLSGGAEVPLTLEGESGSFELAGPPIPGGAGHVKTRVALRITNGGNEVSVRSGDTWVPLARGALTPFVELTFTHAGRTTRGIARFMLVGGAPGVHVFVTPVSIHPRAPLTPVSYPSAFAATVADELGHLYKTVGWDHDTSGLNTEVVDDAAFLREMDEIERDRREMLLDALDRDDFRMLIWVSTATDRVAHMFYRLIDPEHPRYDAALVAALGNPIEREYRRMDETIGLVLPRLRPDDTLLIVSDHGFHNYRRGVHVNSWLRENGFQALKPGVTAGEDLGDLDWSQTQAYALGTGQIYLNVSGREPSGIVSQNQMPEVMRRIREGLLALRDVERGNAQPIARVYEGRAIYRGRRTTEGPDLQVAFAENYRTSWESILGASPPGLFADNPYKWSGDHSASDVAETPGILISNRAVADQPAIVGIAPTALRFFGRAVPRHYEGRSVLREEATR